jgi:hypothetical protein
VNPAEVAEPLVRSPWLVLAWLFAGVAFVAAAGMIYNAARAARLRRSMRVDVAPVERRDSLSQFRAIVNDRRRRNGL